MAPPHEPHLEVHTDAGAFLDALRPMWAHREAELSLFAGVAMSLRDVPRPEGAVLLAAIDGAAVVRTPPYGFIVAEATRGAAAELARALARRGLHLDARTAVATTQAAREFASAWAEATSRAASLEAAQHIYSLERVVHATACVAALSQHALDAGKRFVCSYTDAANPISNAIHRRLGYTPVGDSEVWAFT